MKPILCLDFDGVIHSYMSGWKGAEVIPDPPVPGAFDFITRAVEKFEVVISSSRLRYGFDALTAMQAWLLERGLPEPIFHQLKFEVEKPAAHVTIDDRALAFEGEWPSLQYLLDFKPWTKRGV